MASSQHHKRILERIEREIKSPKKLSGNRAMMKAIRELTDIIIQMRQEKELLMLALAESKENKK